MEQVTKQGVEDAEHIAKVADMIHMRGLELGRECIQVMLETIYLKGENKQANIALKDLKSMEELFREESI